MFVRPHHKQRFRQTCADLTGQAAAGSGSRMPESQEGSPAGPPDLAPGAAGPGRGALPAPLLPCPPQPHPALAGGVGGLW